MAKKLYEESRIAAIAEKIREKTGTSESYTTAEMPSGVEAVFEAGAASGGGMPVVEEKDVNFYDYDGTLLHSYTLAEAQALTELPPLPQQEGLICQGWSWTLADLKTYAKPNDIMPFYVTNDGATWYDIENNFGRDVTVTFRWQAKGQPVTLDFGDGSTPHTDSTASSGSVVAVTHTYSPGIYRAKLSGKHALEGGNAVSDISDIACITLKRAFLGTGIGSLGAYCFRTCVNMVTCTTTSTVSHAGGQTFNKCYNLKALAISSVGKVLPSTYIDGCPSLKVVSFQNGLTGWYGAQTVDGLKRFCIPDTCTKFNAAVSCESLGYINIPEGVTSFANNAFRRNYSLNCLTIPSSVTTIGSQAFQDNAALLVLRFLPTTPPTVANENAFSGIPTNCVVEVPSASLATYKAATNYASISAQMVGV